MRALQHLTLVTALVAGGAAAQAAVQPPLRLCADPANLPFSSNNGSGPPGLYVEIGQAVAEALGRPMETVWSLSYFGKRNLRTTLLAGQCDLAVGVPATDDFMGPRLIFSRTIMNLGYALVVPKAWHAKGLDALKGRRVAVQFSTPPQSLLAARNDSTLVTVMDPEEGMRKLAAGDADAAFIWGANAAWINHSQLNDGYDIIAVEAQQMQWPTAIGFSGKQTELRDQVNAVLDRLQPRILALTQKYALAAAAPVVTATDAGPVKTAVADNQPINAGEGRQIFDGTCAHCHGPNAIVADRKINLRLLKRKYGDEMDAVFFTTVTEGRPSKGMPTWKEVFKQQDFVNILAFLKTVQEQ
jgi:ABC-type amino acid transport substrate-binding protein